MSIPSGLQTVELTFREAIGAALAEEFERQPGMVVLGEDLLPGGGAFGIHANMASTNYASRIIESPISESAIVGVALGAALTGGPAVAEIMYSDFLTVAMDELINQAAKFRYMTGGQVDVPLVIRAPIGMTKGAAAQHSQSLEAWFAHVPGLIVVMPATPADAKGLMKAALRGKDPVIFLEPKFLYGTKGKVPVDVDFTVPFGKADIVRPGTNLTVVATGLMVSRALEAADQLSDSGISVEVIDPRTISPLDFQTIFESVDRTSRALVVNEATLFGSVASEIAAAISEKRFNSLDAPVRRLGAPFVPKPATPRLESMAYPTTEDIVGVSKEMVGD